MDEIDGLSRGKRHEPWWTIANRLAWRNITRDKVRLSIAVAGVALAVLLMAVQLGLLIGFATTASSLIDRSKADFWVAPRGAKDVDQAAQIFERQKFAALGTHGVASVQSLIVSFAPWKRPDGGTESVIVVGVDPIGPALQPWNFVQGSAENLRISDAIVIDELYAGKLGISQIGQTVEILGHRARIAGITSGIRTFTQSPYVFASLNTARRLSGLPQNRTTYLLVRAESGADLAGVQNALQAAIPSAEVWTSRGFSWQTRIYWLFTTGAGTALLIAAVLGLVVGLVIVAQTLYSLTLERMHEFATIRAMGADGGYIKAILLRQALIGAALGYPPGIAAALVLVWLARRSSVALSVPLPLIASLAVVSVAMCAAGSLISIRRVLRFDPATVLR